MCRSMLALGLIMSTLAGCDSDESTNTPHTERTNSDSDEF